ncbi:hypothetical protein PR048_012550 [Dryococelus australis]|uniref:DDE-1 domain-containing protein n=1 Tax=Dryococelus australis TaxID=614101 RepID=A0ABQ9HPQ3_9NEOP|nr:hypothetical protein PR048_012550 [Dryococelus australis]
MTACGEGQFKNDCSKFSKLHGIIIVTIPPHSSHHLQPLKSLFLTTEEGVPEEGDILIKVNAQRIIRHDELAALFNSAYSHVATLAKNVSEFKAKCIMPLDINTFVN